MKVVQSDASAALFGVKTEGTLRDEELCSRAQTSTLNTLVKSRILTEDQARQFGEYLDQSNVSVADILPTMAQLQGIDDDSVAETVEAWSKKMTMALRKRYPMIPFAGGVANAGNLFERYKDIYELVKNLKIPVLFVEDSDVIGLGVINPCLGDFVSDQVVETILQREFIKPFVSVILLDYKSWAQLCRRQFGDD